MKKSVITKRDELRGPKGEVICISMCDLESHFGMLRRPTAKQLKAAKLTLEEWEEAAFIYLELEANASLDRSGVLLQKFPARKCRVHLKALEFIEAGKQKKDHLKVGQFIRQQRKLHDMKKK